MKNLSLTLCSVFFLCSFGKGQTFTFSELNNLYQKEHPIGIIEVLESKNFVWQSKDMGERGHYTYRNSEFFYSTLCFVFFDKQHEDLIPRYDLTIQFEFTKNSKKDYDYLVNKINQYCKNVIDPFSEGDDSYKVHENHTRYHYFVVEANGRLHYVLQIFYPQSLNL